MLPALLGAARRGVSAAGLARQVVLATSHEPALQQRALAADAESGGSVPAAAAADQPPPSPAAAKPPPRPRRSKAAAVDAVPDNSPSPEPATSSSGRRAPEQRAPQQQRRAANTTSDTTSPPPLFVRLTSRYDLSRALVSDVLDFFEEPRLAPRHVRARYAGGRPAAVYVQLPDEAAYHAALRLHKSMLGPVQVSVEGARGHVDAWAALAPRAEGGGGGGARGGGGMGAGPAARGSMLVSVRGLPAGATAADVAALFAGYDTLGHAVSLREGARNATVRLASEGEGFRAVRELTGREVNGARVTLSWLL